MNSAGPSFSPSLNFKNIQLKKGEFYFEPDKNQQFELVTPSNPGSSGLGGRLRAALSGRRGTDSETKADSSGGAKSVPAADPAYQLKLFEASKAYALKLPAARHPALHFFLTLIAERDCKQLTKADLSYQYASLLGSFAESVANFAAPDELALDKALFSKLATRSDEIEKLIKQIPGYTEKTAQAMRAGFISDLTRVTLEEIHSDRVLKAQLSVKSYASINARRREELAQVERQIAELKNDPSKDKTHGKSGALNDRKNALNNVIVPQIDGYFDPSAAEEVVKRIDNYVDTALNHLKQPQAGWFSTKTAEVRSAHIQAFKRAHEQDTGDLQRLRVAINKGQLEGFFPPWRLAALEGLRGKPGFAVQRTQCETLLRQMAEIGTEALAYVEQGIESRLGPLNKVRALVPLTIEAQESFSKKDFDDAFGELVRTLGVEVDDAERLLKLCARVATPDMADVKARALEMFCAKFEPRKDQKNSMAVTALAPLKYCDFLERSLLEFAQARPQPASLQLSTGRESKEKKSSPDS